MWPTLSVHWAQIHVYMRMYECDMQVSNQSFKYSIDARARAKVSAQHEINPNP